jgi:hypothetical protein
MTPHNLQLLKLYDDLPLSAVVPTVVVAALRGCSPKTVRRRYKLVRITDRLRGVLKRELEKSEQTAAA